MYDCNVVMWSWWDWGLISTTVFILQCYDTVGWVKKNLLLAAKRLAVKNLPKMTYHVSSGTLNSTLLYIEVFVH